MLTAEAASDYYELTLIESDFGLIGLAELYARLSFLHRNSDADLFYPPLDYDDLIGRPLDEDDNQTIGEWTVESSFIPEARERQITGRHRVSIPPQPLLMAFRSPSVPGARNWVFHQVDVDPNPSIPHGHDSLSAQKLDAYTGFTYIKRRQMGREPRGLIVALWNDDKFRIFARKAVQWYMTNYPRYRWRVKNPLKFPKY